jgi:archaellum component FlaC
MPTTIKDLTLLIEKQSVEINRLQARVSGLVDELQATKNEVSTFKTQVASDMQRVVTNVRANMVPGVGIAG